MEPIALEPVDAVTVTTLVDNFTDALLPDTGPAKRAPFTLATAGDVLRAEHGFSCLVTITKGDADDADPVRHRDHRGRADREHAAARALAAGHRHHRAEPRALGPHHRDARARGRARPRPSLPVLLHPEFWNLRRVVLPGREPIELPSTSRSALDGAGFDVVEEQQPSFLLDGSLLVTGEVDRTTDFEQGFPAHQAQRHGPGSPTR